MGNVDHIYNNIVDVECDCIINGIGQNASTYGAICKAIVDKAHSPSFESKIVQDHGKPIGTVSYIKASTMTPHGENKTGLKCNSIVNIVLPYFKYDSDYSAYQRCIADALMMCYKKGEKNVLIPILGSGACGYDYEKSSHYIYQISKAFTNLYKCMNVIICLRNPEINKLSRRVEEIRPNDREKIEKEINNIINKINEARSHSKIYDRNFFELNADPKDKIVTTNIENRKSIEFNKELNTIDEYVRYYLDLRYDRDNLKNKAMMNIKRYLAKDISKNTPNTDPKVKISVSKLYNKFKNSKGTDKRNYIRIAFALEMNLYEIQSFLAKFNQGLNEYNPLDKFIMSYIDNNIYDSYKLESLFNQYTDIYYH